MTTHRTVGDALADPNSNLAKKIARAQAGMQENRRKIDAWIADGLTHEEAWSRLFAEQRARLFG